ncbi:hypothetical protein K438DRAFT_2000066 [Mycena galopus ATCC 62051]|nr:hypothetical protein K438DRAFT_2000066 [Mycena galopus ATCC 62051]
MPSATESATEASAQLVKPALSPASIAAIACGILSFLLILFIAIFLLIRRSRRLAPVFHVGLAQNRGGNTAVSAKSRRAMLPQSRDDTTAFAPPGAEQRQQLLAESIAAVQRELSALSTTGRESVAESAHDAVRERIESLQERIRALEDQLRSQWALGLSDEPPPGYLSEDDGVP